MNTASPKPDSASGAFWRFSLDLYGRPGVADVCVTLQDRHGRDVNLLLFAIWVGVSGRGRLSDADLAAADAMLMPWRRETIEPLRAIRRRLKSDNMAASLYDAVKAAELEAEHVAQDRLEKLAPPARVDAVPRDDAFANLARYLGVVDLPAALQTAVSAMID